MNQPKYLLMSALGGALIGLGALALVFGGISTFGLGLTAAGLILMMYAVKRNGRK